MVDLFELGDFKIFVSEFDSSRYSVLNQDLKDKRFSGNSFNI